MFDLFLNTAFFFIGPELVRKGGKIITSADDPRPAELNRLSDPASEAIGVLLRAA